MEVTDLQGLRERSLATASGLGLGPAFDGGLCVTL